MKALKYMLFVLFLQAGAYYLNAQTTTIIANLHDTLKPKTTYLSNPRFFATIAATMIIAKSGMP